MSTKISVVSVSLALVAFLLLSCAPAEDSALGAIFEKPFSAKVSVTNDEGGYSATVTLASAEQITDTDETGQTAVRDGNIVYTSPDSLTDISAVRTAGTVSVNVSGIDIVPSPNIAQKYTYLIDVLDLRASELSETKRQELDGVQSTVLTFISDGREVRVSVESGTGRPTSLESEGIRLTFDEFTYT